MVPPPDVQSASSLVEWLCEGLELGEVTLLLKSMLCGIKKITPVWYLGVALPSTKKAHMKYTRSVWKAVIRADLTAGHCCLPPCLSTLITCLGGDRNAFWETYSSHRAQCSWLGQSWANKMHPNDGQLGKGNLSAPKNNKRSFECFPVPDVFGVSTARVLQELLGLCFCLPFCAGELGVFTLMMILHWKSKWKGHLL